MTLGKVGNNLDSFLQMNQFSQPVTASKPSRSSRNKGRDRSKKSTSVANQSYSQAGLSNVISIPNEMQDQFVMDPSQNLAAAANIVDPNMINLGLPQMNFGDLPSNNTISLANPFLT